jgi:hypothetical protein
MLVHILVAYAVAPEEKVDIKNYYEASGHCKEKPKVEGMYKIGFPMYKLAGTVAVPGAEFATHPEGLEPSKNGYAFLDNKYAAYKAKGELLYEHRTTAQCLGTSMLETVVNKVEPLVTVLDTDIEVYKNKDYRAAMVELQSVYESEQQLHFIQRIQTCKSIQFATDMENWLPFGCVGDGSTVNNAVINLPMSPAADQTVQDYQYDEDKMAGIVSRFVDASSKLKGIVVKSNGIAKALQKGMLNVTDTFDITLEDYLNTLFIIHAGVKLPLLGYTKEWPLEDILKNWKPLGTEKNLTLWRSLVAESDQGTAEFGNLTPVNRKLARLTDYPALYAMLGWYLTTFLSENCASQKRGEDIHVAYNVFFNANQLAGTPESPCGKRVTGQDERTVNIPDVSNVPWLKKMFV